MKRTMNTPGFTAEATLYSGKGGYQATPGAVVYGWNCTSSDSASAPRAVLLEVSGGCGGDPSDPYKLRMAYIGRSSESAHRRM